MPSVVTPPGTGFAPPKLRISARHVAVEASSSNVATMYAMATKIVKVARATVVTVAAMMFVNRDWMKTVSVAQPTAVNVAAMISAKSTSMKTALAAKLTVASAKMIAASITVAPNVATPSAPR
jgi:hypothetical protein